KVGLRRLVAAISTDCAEHRAAQSPLWAGTGFAGPVRTDWHLKNRLGDFSDREPPLGQMAAIRSRALGAIGTIRPFTEQDSPMKKTHYSPATELVAGIGNTAHKVIGAYRSSGEWLADTAAARWNRAFKESSPQLSAETRR